METFKAYQYTDIPTKTIKENIDIFAEILLSSYNESIEKSNFLSSLRIANITAIFQKVTKILRITTDHLAHFQMSPK